MGGAQAAAVLADAVFKADVGEVVAGVAAAHLALPVHHAEGAQVGGDDPIAVVDAAAAAAGDDAGVGIGRRGGVGVVVVVGAGGGDGAEAGEGEGLQAALTHGAGAGGVLIVVEVYLTHKAERTAAEVAAGGDAAGGGGEAVGVRAGGHQRRGAVAAADGAGVLAGEAAQDHTAAAELVDLDVRHGVASGDQAAGAAGQAAQVHTGVVAAAGELRCADGAGADGAAVVADQAAQVEDTALVGVAADGVARGGAVVDSALAAASQRAGVGGAQGDGTPEGDRAGGLAGEEDDIAQGAAVQTEETGVGTVLGTGEGHGGDGVFAAVVDVGEGSGIGGADGLLDGDGGTIKAVVPVIGGVVDGALLLEHGAAGQGRAVLGVVEAERVQLPGGADGDLRGGIRAVGTLGDAAGEVGGEPVGDVIRLQLQVEVGGDLGGVHQVDGQREEVVVVCLVNKDGIGGVEDVGLLGAVVQGEAEGDVGSGAAVEDHAVAVAQDGETVGQGGEVGAAEAVGAVGVDLVVGQGTGLELRLPVAVVGQAGEAGVGVGTEAHAGHQVVGHGAAGLGGEGCVQAVRHGGGAVGAAPGLVGGVGGAGKVLGAMGHIVGVVRLEGTGGGRRGPGGGVGEPAGGIQGGADGVAIGEGVTAGEFAAGETGGGGGGQEARGVALPQGDVCRAGAAADKAAGGTIEGGGVQVAVGVGVPHMDGGGAADIAHKAASVLGALQHGGSKAVGDGQVKGALTHQAAHSGAPEPDVLFGFGAEFVPGGTEVHLAAVDDSGAAEGAHKAAGGAGGGDVRAAEADAAQGAAEAVEQAAAAGGAHRKAVDDRVVLLAVHQDGAGVAGQVSIADGTELQTAVQGGPVVIGTVVDELDVLLLQGSSDGTGQAGVLVQILQVAGVVDHGSGAAVLQGGEEAVGGELSGDGVHQLAVADHLDLDGQVGAGGQGIEPPLLAEAHAVGELVQHHGGGVGAVGHAELRAGDLHTGGGVAEAVGDGHVEVQGVAGGSAGDLQQQALLVLDLELGGEGAGVLGLGTVAAVIAHNGAVLQTPVPGTQVVEAVEGVGHGLLAVEHGVDAAAGRVILNDPVGVPQLLFQLVLGQDGVGGGGGVLLGVGGGIVQGGGSVLVLLRVPGDIVQGQSAVGGVVRAAPVGLQLGETVLRRHVDGLRLAVQLRLTQTALVTGNGDHGQPHQHDEDGHGQQYLRQGEAPCIPFCVSLPHGESTPTLTAGQGMISK